MVMFRYGFKGLRLGIMLGLGLEIVRFSMTEYDSQIT